MPPVQQERPILAVTGAAGWVGRHVVPLLRPRFKLRLIDLQPIEPLSGEEVRLCDLTDLEAALDAVAGAHAVLHLAAVAGDGNFLRDVVPNNIVGAYNVFEGARLGGVEVMVFASSGQVVLGYETDAFVTTDMPARPIGPYAASKLFGEALGRHYHEDHGIRMFSLRMGWFGPAYTDEMREDPVGWCWLSPRDLANLVVACIESREQYGVYFAASRGAESHWDLSEPGSRVGWKPKDSPT